MVYNEQLAQRVRTTLIRLKGFSERKMFGGMCFLLDGKMLCGVLQDNFVARIDPADAERLLKRPRVAPMDFTGRPMRGFLCVDIAGVRTEKQLEGWIAACRSYVGSK